MKIRHWDDRKIVIVVFPIFGAILGGLFVHFGLFDPTVLDYLYVTSGCTFISTLCGIFVSGELTKMKMEMTNQVK